MTKALVLTGGGRYADPWHSFAATSARLAGLLAEAGHEVVVRDDVDAALGELDGPLADVGLLVVNAGDPLRSVRDGRPEPPPAPPAEVLAAASAGLDAALERGIGVLAVHAAVMSLRDHPAWFECLGGEWVWGESSHPPFGTVRAKLGGNHPIAQGPDFAVEDEAYEHLRFAEVFEPIAEHERDGIRYPLVWARESGRSRAVVDVLGHSVQSYESVEHRALLLRAIEWLAIGRDTGALAAVDPRP